MRISGTDYRYVNVRVIPSLHDIGQTEGLCQMLDGEREEQLIGRNNSMQTDCTSRDNEQIKEFLKTWRLINIIIGFSLSLTEILLKILICFRAFLFLIKTY